MQRLLLHDERYFIRIFCKRKEPSAFATTALVARDFEMLPIDQCLDDGMRDSREFVARDRRKY